MNAKSVGAALTMAFLAAAMQSAVAQPAASSGGDKGNNAPNALQGFQQNRGQPVQIEASRLEVRDKDKMATFSGNVKVVQGDTTMRCKTLVVFYEQQSKDGQQALAAAQTMPAAKPGPGGSSQISKLEAGGGVTVTQKDQTATGDRALFDMRSNTVTLLGNVVVSQGPNVMRGEKLVVDLTTGVSRVEAGKGPVRMLIQQGPPQEKGGAALPKFGPQRPSSNSTN
ncbi:MAG: lipopolysaccharide export system protein LptA [Alphaproteobacteria bacterium]|jgi:lipopolysaccharide export system protein LptA|nr:lipopolysaccharide export system protein LptA [Alphaproteobacteria bacterium]